jgi:DNA-binding MarR family transcriptional regulator
LPAQQHQALLAVAGYRGPNRPTVGYLVDQLLVAPHTAAELVARMVETGLLLKEASSRDRRRMELKLTAKAEDLLRVLTPVHLEELRNLEPALAGALGKLSRARPKANGSR